MEEAALGLGRRPQQGSAGSLLAVAFAVRFALLCALCMIYRA